MNTGHSITQLEAEEVIAANDSSSTGSLSLEDFSKMLLSEKVKIADLHS